MAQDAFERAAARHERLEDSGRRVLGLRLFAVMISGDALGIGAVMATTDGGFDAVAPVIVVSSITAVVMALFVGWGGVKLSPLFHAGTLDALRVQGAVMRGRAVRQPELAGLAVSAAQYAGAHRWMAIVGALGASVLAGLVGLRWGWIGWALGSVVLAPALATLSMAMNAARAEAANRALLEG